MSLILSIETATACCSVALSKDDKVLFFKEEIKQNIHATHITLFIREVMQMAGYKYDDLDAVAISMGPGSYTGLRIGVSTAKGLCYALDKPLIAVNTLEAMAYGFISKHKQSINQKSLFCPMIDARRMEVYDLLLDDEMNCIREIKADIIDEQSFNEEFKDNIIYFFGDGADKTRSLLVNENAKFDNENYNSAKNIAALAYKKYKKQAFEDVAYFEPFYLKDFIATTPKVKS